MCHITIIFCNTRKKKDSNSLPSKTDDDFFGVTINQTSLFLLPKRQLFVFLTKLYLFEL